MKKRELLEIMDDEWMEKLYGFCYARTSDSYEAQELCSDILLELVKAANTEGDIENPYPYIWRVARNVYAKFSDRRRRQADLFYEGDADEVFSMVLADEEEDDSEELLRAVYRRIAFLTQAYREAMILFYLDGLSTAEIARQQNISEGTVRQRLFSARQKIKSEVKDMKDRKEYNKPVALDRMDYVIWGNGDPGWDDPRNVCTRQFSKHVVWLCQQKPRSAAEIADELNVPTMYVEEELAILANGERGRYGLLRQLENRRYALNFILFDKPTIQKAHDIYLQQMTGISRIAADFVEEHKEEYLAFPYMNKKVDLNLILWQQVTTIAGAFAGTVDKILFEKYFTQIEKTNRPFSVFGYADYGKEYGYGCDGASAKNICGFSKVHIENIYVARIRPHFHCGIHIAMDDQILLALRAINGLAVSSLSETEQEHAAKAIKSGYLYRDGEMLYTKILVSDMKDAKRLFDISKRLYKGYFEAEAEKVAEQMFDIIKKKVPDYLIGEWRYANSLAGLPVLDSLVEILIEKGMLTPPEDGLGAEGCWLLVEQGEL